MFEKAKKVVNNVTIFTNFHQRKPYIYNMYNKCKVLGIIRLDTTEIKKAITGCNYYQID